MNLSDIEAAIAEEIAKRSGGFNSIYDQWLKEGAAIAIEQLKACFQTPILFPEQSDNV